MRVILGLWDIYKLTRGLVVKGRAEDNPLAGLFIISHRSFLILRLFLALEAKLSLAPVFRAPN